MKKDLNTFASSANFALNVGSRIVSIFDHELTIKVVDLTDYDQALTERANDQFTQWFVPTSYFKRTDWTVEKWIKEICGDDGINSPYIRNYCVVIADGFLMIVAHDWFDYLGLVDKN